MKIFYSFTCKKQLGLLDMEDVDRPVNDRGNHDCPWWQRAIEKKIEIDAFEQSR